MLFFVVVVVVHGFCFPKFSDCRYQTPSDSGVWQVVKVVPTDRLNCPSSDMSEYYADRFFLTGCQYSSLFHFTTNVSWLLCFSCCTHSFVCYFCCCFMNSFSFLFVFLPVFFFKNLINVVLKNISVIFIIFEILLTQKVEKLTSLSRSTAYKAIALRISLV